jgi:hypothetical protein
VGKDPWRTRKIFGIFSKLHFFSRRERIRGENLRDFFKVALFFHEGKDPWRTGGKLWDFFKVALFSRRERIHGERENLGIFSKLQFFSRRERIHGERGEGFPSGVLYVPAKSPRM